jgi:plastocyanin
MDQTLFYVFGIALVVAAIALFATGTRNKSFPSGATMTVGLLIFVGLVIATGTFAVLNAKKEQTDRRDKLAAEEKKVGATPVPGGGEVPTPDAAELGAATPAAPPAGAAAPSPPAGQPKAKGPGGTLDIAASPSQLAFNTKSLSSKPGKVTINFTNPAPIQHDVAVEKGKTITGAILAKSDLISQSKTSVSADLAPGTYTVLCTVPGHAQAGMQGTLTVK